MEAGLEWVARGYGKGNVKLLHVRREGIVHTIKEYEVNTQLTLTSDKDYLHGDNSDVVATDSQKNTVYILAKRHGVTSPEDFALLLADHFLDKYGQVTAVTVCVRAYPWQRQVVDGRAHNHAFIFCPEVEHTCTVSRKSGEPPEVWTGMEGMRLLKTTQSSFVNFVQDEFRSLPDMEDRIFSTVVSASWRYTDGTQNTDFGKIWMTVLKVIKDTFSGPAESGIYSPSVQNTVYKILRDVLVQLPEVSQMKVTMPNKHYFNVDLSKFHNVGSKVNNEVFLPVDKPAGIISATLGRKDLVRAKL